MQSAVCSTVVVGGDPRDESSASVPTDGKATSIKNDGDPSISEIQSQQKVLFAPVTATAKQPPSGRSEGNFFTSSGELLLQKHRTQFANGVGDNKIMPSPRNFATPAGEDLLKTLADSMQKQLVTFFRDRDIHCHSTDPEQWCLGGRLSQQLLDPLLEWIASIDTKGKRKSPASRNHMNGAGSGHDELSVDSLAGNAELEEEDDVFTSFSNSSPQQQQELPQWEVPDGMANRQQQQRTIIASPFPPNPLQETEAEDEDAPLPLVRRSQSTTDASSSTTPSPHLTPIVTALLKTIEMLASSLQQMHHCLATMNNESAARSLGSVSVEKKSGNDELNYIGMNRSAVGAGGVMGASKVFLVPSNAAPNTAKSRNADGAPKEGNDLLQQSDRLTFSFLETSIVGVKALKQMRSLQVISVNSLNQQLAVQPVDGAVRYAGTPLRNPAADQNLIESAIDSGLDVSMGVRNAVDRLPPSARDPPPPSGDNNKKEADSAEKIGRPNPFPSSLDDSRSFTPWGRQPSTALMKNHSILTTLPDENHVSHRSAPSVSQFHGTVVVDDSGCAVICQFEILAELGRGNFGKVSLVMDSDGELFALKTLRDRKTVMRLPATRVRARGKPGIAPNGGSTKSLVGASTQSSVSSADCSTSTPDMPQPAATNFVEREIAVMKRLDHPNVVKLHAVIEDPEEGQTHLVMQYVDNGPIGKVADDNTCLPLPFTLALKYMAQVARGLEFLHSQNIIHRDIKPENILIGSDDTAYLSDFGVSSIIADGDRPSGTVGTMSFFSPELLASHSAMEQYGKESDVWAFGVTLYCLLFGKLPFSGNTGPALMRSILMDDITIPDTFPSMTLPEGPPLADLFFQSGDGEWKDSSCPPFLLRHIEDARKVPCGFAVPSKLKELLIGLLDRNPSSRLTLRFFRSATVVRRPERSLEPPVAATHPVDGLTDPIQVPSQIRPFRSPTPATNELASDPHSPSAQIAQRAASIVPPSYSLQSLFGGNSTNRDSSGNPSPLLGDVIAPAQPEGGYAMSTRIDFSGQGSSSQTSSSHHLLLPRQSTAPYITPLASLNSENPLMFPTPPSPESVEGRRGSVDSSALSSTSSHYPCIHDEITEDDAACAVVQCNVLLRRPTNPAPVMTGVGQSMTSLRGFVPGASTSDTVLRRRSEKAVIAGHGLLPPSSCPEPHLQITAPVTSPSPFVSKIRDRAMDARDK